MKRMHTAIRPTIFIRFLPRLPATGRHVNRLYYHSATYVNKGLSAINTRRVNCSKNREDSFRSASPFCFDVFISIVWAVTSVYESLTFLRTSFPPRPSMQNEGYGNEANARSERSMQIAFEKCGIFGPGEPRAINGSQRTERNAKNALRRQIWQPKRGRSWRGGVATACSEP